MAKKRMISQEVIDTDRFLSVSLAARGLYMHLNSVADDDGFISSAKRTTRAVDGTEDMLNELVDAGYLIRFESGIFLVRHWLIHNTIKKDRYTPTQCTKELAQVKTLNGVYYTAADPEWNQIGSAPEPQIRKDKISKDKYKPPQKRNSFNNFNQRDYDYDALEKILLSK